jgi:hypothetical protein
MSLVSEGYSEFVEITKDKAKSIIYSILYKSVLSGDVNPGEYIVIDDDGIFIGNESDFDADVLLYAIPVNDIVDFDNIEDGNDFIDFSNSDIDKILYHISS